MKRMDKYLRPTFAIDCDSKSIKEKAQGLIKGRDGDIEKAKSVFYFVRDEIKYNPYAASDLLEDYRASVILERGEGFCVQKAVLLAALARAADIPGRLRSAVICNYLLSDKLIELMGTTLIVFHGYNDLYIEGKWIKATPTFDLVMCQENRIIPVEFDGRNDAVFHSHNSDGELHIEYVQLHGHYDDLPFDKIVSMIVQAYGTEYFEKNRKLVEERIAKEQNSCTSN